jgi:hypothetical protein
MVYNFLEMDTTSIVNATLSCFVATVLVIGFTAAPVAAADGTGISIGGDGVSADIGDDVSVNASTDDGVSADIGDDVSVNASTDDGVSADIGDDVSVDASTDDGVNVDEDVDVEEETDPDVQTPAIPAPTGGDDGGSEGGPVPEAVCTDVPGAVHENVPYEQVPWVSDLPEEAQPPGVPWGVLTPEGLVGIVVGIVPNQCEVVDPNDPPYNPTSGGDDNVDPAADVQVSRLGSYEGGGVAVIHYDVTLDETSEHGPGTSGTVGLLATPEFGDVDLEVAVHDGEKEYAVDPRVRYLDGGRTAYVETDVRLLNKRLGVNVDCNGEECQPGTKGLPELIGLPAIPAPTGGN